MSRSHLTAIVRKQPSLPITLLKGKGLIKPKVLDYGCGRGFDAKHLKCDKYDPYYAPDEPRAKYQTILCTYVLNVVRKEEESKILKAIQKLLLPQGRAYITVRRDIKADYETKNGIQRVVVLPLPTVWTEHRKYSVYAMGRDDKV